MASIKLKIVSLSKDFVLKLLEVFLEICPPPTGASGKINVGEDG